MAENSGKKIKIITVPDMMFDQAESWLVITPGADLKNHVQDYAVSSENHLNIYVYTGLENDIKWLLTVAKTVDNILIDIDNCPEDIIQFLSYLLSFPNTYYRTVNMRSPWDLLNKNRFYDFPKLNEDSNEGS
jgi:hypothetical protein